MRYIAAWMKVTKIRGVFLDTSKVFDKVWYKSLVFKLKQNEISGLF